MGHATEIVLGTRTSRLSLLPGDVDWFGFTLAANHGIELGRDPPGIGAGVRLLMWLLTGDGEALRLVDEWPPFIMEKLDAGTYAVVVSAPPDWDRVGDHAHAFLYALELLDDPEDLDRSRWWTAAERRPRVPFSWAALVRGDGVDISIRCGLISRSTRPQVTWGDLCASLPSMIASTRQPQFARHPACDPISNAGMADTQEDGAWSIRDECPSGRLAP